MGFVLWFSFSLSLNIVFHCDICLFDLVSPKIAFLQDFPARVHTRLPLSSTAPLPTS